jgi:hypothetical protein
MNLRTLCLTVLAITCLLPRAAEAVVPPATTITMVVSNGAGFAASWNAVSTATQYYLWVTDSSGVVRHQVWYTTQQVGCNTGQAVCQKVLSLPLQPGTTYIWVQTWNTDGYGPWSAEYQTLSHYGHSRVYDSAASPKFMGVMFDSNRLLIDYNGTPTLFAVGGGGFFQTGIIAYYEGAICGGTPRASATFPSQADIAGTTVFVRTGNQINNFAYGSTRTYSTDGTPGMCTVSNSTLSFAQVVNIVTLSSIFGTPVPPFTIVR